MSNPISIQYGTKPRLIKKILDDKIEDWLASIEDQPLRRAMRQDIIVTGGSITSMLLGERINDFDVYFRRKSTVLQVAKYYLDKFLAWKPSYNTSEVIEKRIKNCKGEEEDRVVVFIKSKGVLGAEEELYEDTVPEEVLKSLDVNPKKEELPPYTPVFISPNAITLNSKLQVVIRFFGEPAQIHGNYDFVHCMCYYDHHKGHLELPAKALQAMLTRTLIYRGSLYPIASIFRMKKFVQRGWRISAGQQLKIMWQVNELDLKDKEVLYEQLTGVDFTYMMMFLDAVKHAQEENPGAVDSSHVAEILDRIFEGA